MIRRDEIIGTWTLRSYQNVSETGYVEYPLGSDAVGIIIFTADGYMSAQLMRRERPDYDRASTTGGTVEQAAEAARGYLAYAGPFDWEENPPTSHHHVEVSLLPTWLGHTQIRQARLHDGILTLSAKIRQRGADWTATLRWERP
jgi:hypothetical protein